MLLLRAMLLQAKVLTIHWHNSYLNHSEIHYFPKYSYPTQAGVSKCHPNPENYLIQSSLIE